MHLNDFPPEILSSILEHAAKLNERHGVTFTYGLSLPHGEKKLQRYVRGPVPPDLLSWDASAPIRQVCSAWHDWALAYALKNLFIRKWRGGERWAELPMRRENYRIYELMGRPLGTPVYRDPFSCLRTTTDLLTKYPSLAAKVRRLWFNGFYTPETDTQIFAALRQCSSLRAVGIPWTTIRHIGAEDWASLLSGKDGQGLTSLELLAVDLTESQSKETMAAQAVDMRPLESPLLDFSSLRRLKLFGNTSFMPINDDDLQAIARTATNLEEFHITALSTVTIEGVMAIVRSSRSTLRVLEHSPRGDEGFSHPHPGFSSSQEHICALLTSCPRLQDLSISIPSMCPLLFANHTVRWAGECQVRALRLCDHQHPNSKQPPSAAAGAVAAADTLRQLLDNARELSRAAAQSVVPRKLSVELFFAGCVFDPAEEAVHGSFGMAELISRGHWPMEKKPSPKGPYGSTGLYGKEDEEGIWDRVSETEYLEGLRMGWVPIDG